ncbi:MAG: WD40 repeat domain-containing protein, partial [Hyphomicrobiaceae bacterium]
MKPWKIGVSYAVAFSPDGRLLATLGRDVSIWDLALRSKVVRAHPFSHPSDAAFSPDQRHLVVKGTSGQIVIIDVQSGRIVVDFGNAAEGEGSNLQYSPCGEYILDGTWSGRLSVRRASSGALEFVQEFHGEMIRSVHRSDDGRCWVIAHGAKATANDRPPPPDYFSAWAWPFGSAGHRILPERIAFSRSSALSADGALLAVVHGAPPDTLSVFQIDDGACAGVVSIQGGGTGHALGWSNDGRLIGSVQDQNVVFYTWPGLRKMHELALAYPSDVAFSPRGDALAVGSWQVGWVLSADRLATTTLPQKPDRLSGG